jgi:DGQHR domain-containing protein
MTLKSVRNPPPPFLRVPAVEVRQGPKRRLFTFAVDGKLVPQFATVSRVRRNDAELEGYQRPEVISHINEIRSYIESEAPLVPNAVVIAFDSRVKFEPIAGPSTPYARCGTLHIPLVAPDGPNDVAGFIVDGQQRLAAVRDAAVEAFPLCVSAFITNDLGEQTEQFILVNSTKPLPKGLIYELLPTTQAKLPTALHRRRFPSSLLERLNRSPGSPFKGMIQTPTNPNGIIKDNSVLRMLEQSLSDGVLYRFRDDKGQGDVEAMLEVLTNYWTAVREIFPEAWGLPPKRSRLMHGAGILGMGFLMDAIADKHRETDRCETSVFAAELKPLKKICRWTEGYWDFGPGQQRKWNELQNTSRDIELLTNFLMISFRQATYRARRSTG